MPQKRLQIGRFVEMFGRIFPDTDDRQRTTVRRIAGDVAESTHGTIVIIHRNAAEEAARFGNQALVIAPIPPTTALLKQASRIDGAILAAPDGVCYAIGVILDGPVSEKGNNDAERESTRQFETYTRTTGRVLGWWFSNDGMIDIVPEYRPTMSRREIERKIEKLREIAGKESVSQRELNDVTAWLSKHRFVINLLVLLSSESALCKSRLRPWCPDAGSTASAGDLAPRQDKLITWYQAHSGC